MKVIGHRGCAGLEPENTLLGFKRAIELGVSELELDIHMTKDGRIVVIHDGTLDRTTSMKGKVLDHTYEELKKADAGKGESIPLLSDVLALIKDKDIIIDIELKEPGLVEPLLEKVVPTDMLTKISIISFWHRELVKVKKFSYIIKTGALMVNNPVYAKTIFHDTLADYISIVHDMADKSLVDDTHMYKKKIYVWGKIDDKQKIDRLVGLGVDGIASDFPDLVINRLKELGKVVE